MRRAGTADLIGGGTARRWRLLSARPVLSNSETIGEPYDVMRQMDDSARGCLLAPGGTDDGVRGNSDNRASRRDGRTSVTETRNLGEFDFGIG